MSVSDHLTPLSPQVSVSSPQPKKHLTVPLPLPNSLSSPVIKKKVIQIPSFDCQGLVFEKNSSRPFAPICPSEPTVCVSSKTPSQASISECYQLSQTNDGERPATLPRTKLKTNPVSPFLSTRPNNSFIPIAPKPNSSPTLPTQKLKPSNYLNLPASQTNVSSSLSQPKTSISPTLRLSPSPTAMSQMMPFDSQGAKQSSPVAQERRAKSIPISNSKTQPESGIPRFSKESKCDVLDQNVLLDFTRSELRRSSKDILNREMYQTSSLLQDKHGLRKTGNSAKPLPMPPLGKGEIGTMPKTKSNIKERQGSGILPDGMTGRQSNCVSGGITVTNAERESQSASDELAAQSIRRSSRTTPDYLPKYYTQPQPASVTYHQSCTDMQPNRSSILSTTPKVSSSTASLLSQSNPPPTKEARRRYYDLYTESSAASTFSKSDHHKTCQVEEFANTMSTESSSQLFQQTGTSRNTKAIQKPRSWSRAQCQNSQMDPQIAVSHSDCTSLHNGSQSKNSDRKPEAPRYGLPRLNKSKTGPIVAHQIQEASQTPSFESQAFAPDTSLSGKNSKLFSVPKTNLFDYEQSVQNINLRGVDPRDLELNQTDLPAPPDHKGSTKPPEYSLEKCTVSWPPSMVGHNSSNTTGAGTGSKGVFESPFQPKGIDCQRQNEMTTVTFPSQTPHHPLLGRVYIAEDPEDPYYVTMYHPGSVYVSMDMSDIVPPEVKPKPAVPAKPPHVGAPSPSSPFPPQGPGFGGAAPAPAPPPSAIPVLIGGPGGHGGTRDATGQSGGHNAALSQGGSHSTGSHNTSGGSTLLGYIGIDTIIEQMRKKTVKTGFDFNIMVVGNSGLGKSTLINTLFKSQISRRSGGWARDEKIPKTVEIKSVAHFIEEGGVKMKLTVIDTPGFGDLINNDNCWDPIAKYINEQYEKFLKEEVNITRKKRIPDTRVHCCLYFISPTGHSLRQLDIEFMKHLSHSVNIIPVIAKADTMTIDERQEFKQRVRKELEMGGIEFYPQKEFDEDMEDKSENDKIREAMPFAVVGSDKEYQVNNKRVLGRKTPWGVVEVENPNHCEFSQLRDFLIRSHLQDLKEVTHNIHYETYRAKRLNANGGLHPICSNDTIESNL